jgi:hypothetical protein
MRRNSPRSSPLPPNRISAAVCSACVFALLPGGVARGQGVEPSKWHNASGTARINLGAFDDASSARRACPVSACKSGALLLCSL